MTVTINLRLFVSAILHFSYGSQLHKQCAAHCRRETRSTWDTEVLGRFIIVVPIFAFFLVIACSSSKRYRLSGLRKTLEYTVLFSVFVVH